MQLARDLDRDLRDELFTRGPRLWKQLRRRRFNRALAAVDMRTLLRDLDTIETERVHL